MFKKIAGVVVGVVASTGSAFAALPTDVSTGLSTAAVDAAAAAGLALLVTIGVYAIKAIRKGL